MAFHVFIYPSNLNNLGSLKIVFEIVKVLIYTQSIQNGNVDAVKARVQLRVPDKLWLATVSQRHPSSTFYILSFLPTKERTGNALIKIEGGNVRRILDEIREHPSLVELTVLASPKARR